MNVNGKILFWFLLFSSSFLYAQEANQPGLKSDIINEAYIGGLKNGTPLSKSGVTKKDYIVRNKADLIKCLKLAKEGEVVYVDNNASINLTGTKRLIIPSGVTLASGRGVNGSKGGILYTTTNGTVPLLVAGGPNVSIIGLRIKGPDTGIYANGKDAFAGKSTAEKKKDRLKLYRQNMYGVPISEGIQNRYKGFQIKNCEVFGWTHAAIKIAKGGDDARISNNYIHHNQRYGLGYGVVVDGATAIIEGNLFDYNRHSVAGTGRMGSGYEISNNIFKENNNTTWAIDMHGGADRKDGTNLAGTKLLVHNNIIRLKGSALAFVIRGVPSEVAKVYDNEIIYVDKKNTTSVSSTPKSIPKSTQGAVKYIQQRNAQGNVQFFNNSIKD